LVQIFSGFAIRSVTIEASKTPIQAFVSSHLDYCNSLLDGVFDGLVGVTSVQNAIWSAFCDIEMYLLFCVRLYLCFVIF